MTTLLAVRGLSKTTPEFRAALVSMANRLGIDPNFITPVMENESGFNPQARNPYTNATGLIQFMPSTAKQLGTTVDELYSMSSVDQLKYVEYYYKPYASRISTPGDSYMAVFMPAYVGKDPSTIIATSPNKVYTQNKVFDKTNKGYITVGDVEATAESLYNAALNVPPIVDPDGSLPLPPDSQTPVFPPLVVAGMATSSGGAIWWLAAAAAAYYGVRWLWPKMK